jgi:hypothetical protein
MVDGARDRGLLVPDRAYRKQCAVDVTYADGTVHRMGRIWTLLGRRRRPLPRGAEMHSSVRQRSAPPDYRDRIPPDAVWDDPTWPN